MIVILIGWLRHRVRVWRCTRTRPWLGCLPSPAADADASRPDPGGTSPSAQRDLRAGCPICAESLQRLDVAIGLVEQSARAALDFAMASTEVPELTRLVAEAVVVLGVEVELVEPGLEQPARFFADLDQAKAHATEAIRAACPCGTLPPA